MTSSSDFSQIRAFIAVAEALSFSRAAESLGVSPSALSQLIRGLEARTGVRLFHRTTRSVSLTDAGKALFQQVQPAAETLQAAVKQLRKTGERPAGVLRIHSFRRAANIYLLPMLKGFQESFPDVVLDITVDDSVPDLITSGYDAAIRIGEVIARDMVAVKLGREMRQVVIAAPAYLKKYGRPDTPRDLTRHNCIRWRWPGHETPYNWEFSKDGSWFSVAIDGSLITSEKELVIDASLAGVGLGFAVEETVQPLIKAGKLVPLLEDWSAPFPGYYLCYPAQRQMAPALRAFIDAVRGTAGMPLKHLKNMKNT